MFQAIPVEALATDRLLMRPPVLADAPAIVEAAHESLAELRPWMPWAHSNYALADAETFIQRMADGVLRDDLFTGLLFRNTDNQFIGTIGLHDVNWLVPRFEIGYWLRTSAVGRGYMTEAVIHLTHLCRDRFRARRMTIRCDAENVRSRQVAERAGYMFEARTKNDRRSPFDNSLHDMLALALTWPDEPDQTG